MTTRKKYSKEFKLDAVSLVLEQDYSRAEAARSLDINANMLGRWVKELQADDGRAFRGPLLQVLPQLRLPGDRAGRAGGFYTRRRPAR